VTTADISSAVGLAVMAAGLIAILVMLRRGRREDSAHGTLHAFACAVGVVAYLAIVMHRGSVAALGGGSVYVPHYVFWAVSESLTVLAVAIVGLPPLDNQSDHRLRMSLLGGLVGTGLLWVTCGLGQALAHSDSERWTWFALAVVAQGAMLWLLWWPVTHQGEIKGGEHLHDFSLMARAMTALWPLYLLIWLLGVPGLHVWNETGDLIALTVVDLLTNVGVGVFNVRSINAMARDVDSEPGETSIAASARLTSESERQPA
jgi:bacteriorhodopsin